MKSLKIIGIILASLLVIVGLSIGGYKVMKKVEHDEMVRIVESEEAKQIFRNRLTRIDPKAFEPDGVIKTYAINMNLLLPIQWEVLWFPYMSMTIRIIFLVSL